VEQLERRDSPEPDVFDRIDRTHPAGSNARENPVLLGNQRPDEWVTGGTDPLHGMSASRTEAICKRERRAARGARR
jgi:hypothetical protein